MQYFDDIELVFGKTKDAIGFSDIHKIDNELNDYNYKNETLQVKGDLLSRGIRGYVLEKICEETGESYVSDELSEKSTPELVYYLESLIKPEYWTNTTRYLVKYLLEKMSELQGKEIIWEYDDKNRLESPSIIVGDTAINGLVTNANANFATTFEFLYDIFQTHILKKEYQSPYKQIAS